VTLTAADRPTVVSHRRVETIVETSPTLAARPDPLSDPSRRLRVTYVGLLVLTGLWLLIYAVALSPLQSAHRQHALYQGFRTALAKQTAPLGGAIPPGTAVALISAPAADLSNLVVVEGTSGATLADGPGHYRGTPLPGQAGTSYLFGRSVLFGGPFRHVARLRHGDSITVTTQQGPATYVVDRVRHAGDPVPQPLAAGAGRLELVSSEGTGWRSGWAPTQVLYVDAVLAGEPKVALRPAAVTRVRNELAMKVDMSGLIVVVLGLQGLLLAVGGVLWAGSRWSATQTWIVGAPVVLATLWIVTGHALLLLPNLL